MINATVIDDIRVICNKAAYESATREFENYSDNEPACESRDEYRFELLSMLLDVYERETISSLPIRSRSSN